MTNDGGVVNTGLEDTAFEFERGAWVLPELSRLPQSEKCAKNPSANLCSGVSGGKREEREATHGPLRLATLTKHPGDHVLVRVLSRAPHVVPPPGIRAHR